MPRCQFCNSLYKPERPMQPGRVCNSIDCQMSFVEREREKQRKSKAKAERIAGIADRKTIRLRKEQLKTPSQRRSELIKQAEKEVRDYKRLSELLNGCGCISCGRSQSEVMGTDGWKPGGGFDAGHYHGKGARPGLRLEPDNIWLQCKSCNAGSSKYTRKRETVGKQYRENLIKKIGRDRVEELDADDKPRHWPDEELIAIRDKYREKNKILREALRNRS